MDCVHIEFFEFQNNRFLAMVDSYSKWIEIKVANSWKTDNAIKTVNQTMEYSSLLLNLNHL